MSCILLFCARRPGYIFPYAVAMAQSNGGQMDKLASAMRAVVATYPLHPFTPAFCF